MTDPTPVEIPTPAEVQEAILKATIQIRTETGAEVPPTAIVLTPEGMAHVGLAVPKEYWVQVLKQAVAALGGIGVVVVHEAWMLETQPNGEGVAALSAHAAGIPLAELDGTIEVILCRLETETGYHRMGWAQVHPDGSIGEPQYNEVEAEGQLTGVFARTGEEG